MNHIRSRGLRIFCMHAHKPAFFLSLQKSTFQILCYTNYRKRNPPLFHLQFFDFGESRLLCRRSFPFSFPVFRNSFILFLKVLPIVVRKLNALSMARLQQRHSEEAALRNHPGETQGDANFVCKEEPDWQHYHHRHIFPLRHL